MSLIEEAVDEVSAQVDPTEKFVSSEEIRDISREVIARMLEKEKKRTIEIIQNGVGNQYKEVGKLELIEEWEAELNG